MWVIAKKSVSALAAAQNHEVVDALRLKLAPVAVLERAEAVLLLLGQFVAQFRRAEFAAQVAFREAADEVAPEQVLGELLQLFLHRALGEFLVGEILAVDVGLDQVGAAERLGEGE